MKSLVAAVALACGASQASAQASGVTIFGGMDGGMMVSRSGAASAGSLKLVTSGASSASRWGFAVTEDLGSGLKVLGRMEMGLSLDTGSIQPYSSAYGEATPAAPNGPPQQGFGRRSFVALQSDSYGMLAAGRDFAPALQTLLALEAMPAAYFGNLQQILFLVGGQEGTGRISNAVFYTTPWISGARFRAAYGLGSESAGGAGRPPRRTNEFVGVGGDYVWGPLSMSVAYQELTLAQVSGGSYTGVVQARKFTMLGAKYTSSRYVASVGYAKLGSGPFASASLNGIPGDYAWLSGTANFGFHSVSAALHRQRLDAPTGLDPDATTLGLAYTYNLSKRTALYAMYGRTKNNATARFGLIGSEVQVAAGAVGASPSALAVGVRHTF